MNRIEQLIEKYHLHPHPEGGDILRKYILPHTCIRRIENVQAVSISC